MIRADAIFNVPEEVSEILLSELEDGQVVSLEGIQILFARPRL